MRATLIALGVALAPALGHAVPCAPRPAVEAAADELGQTPVIVAMTRGGQVLEFWADRDGRDWTVTVSSPAGVTCIMSGGEAWEEVEPERGDPA